MKRKYGWQRPLPSRPHTKSITQSRLHLQEQLNERLSEGPDHRLSPRGCLSGVAVRRLKRG